MPNAFKSFEAALPAIIAERPKTVMRRREKNLDTFKGPQAYTAGPFTVRIEAMAAGGSEVWDEKGQVARRLFLMLGHNLPRTVEEGGVPVPLFQVNDEITDGDGNRYVVSSPQYVEGKMVQVTLTLRG
jgi:hypothetical protein